ncbi:N-acetylglucosamine-6-phosphate deacetylase [Actinoalloteichus hymeniacidonis]|uniref:N-acetylglucosamine-6-phosphate deacetylase n=1 Tax=Actinoalloteichus hymeniacidonis TaxID=340345 RepID=A0AAC9N0V9_9PSEU|nr:N-acetylglucosamine-6-phosphate deacetylase [Actinoalloteichus hymeniacidonis]AOS66014.1 N-acetylglucosamine-6-phosphate deacetylase [Actinoalloteichus hymeniacidonis]MBB5905884.1 N-acetylglucosamine-6-phosphate deacetylase [Actinoalloteichus hymeniacidonis]
MTNATTTVPRAEAESVLSGARIVTPDGVLDDGWVSIAAGRILGVGTGTPPVSAVTRSLAGRWLVPGFIDIHCHGGGGESFDGESTERIRTAIRTHRATGTTTMLGSLVSGPIPELARQVSRLAELVEDGELAGIHLEGPFLSAARCGAHTPELLRAPDRESVATLLTAGRGAVRMVTLAPELEGAVRAVGQLIDGGSLVAIGHTDAFEAQVLPAVDAGATVATHLFNAMRPLHHREPGPIGTLLDDERVTVELICDLVHLHPTTVRMGARHAGPDRTVLVTDAISATGMGDGQYELGGLQVTVTDGVPLLDNGSLAGSSLTMDVAFRNLVQTCGLSVEDAVAATATRPAAVLGLADEIGCITPGHRADLVVLDEELGLREVLRRGEPA